MTWRYSAVAIALTLAVPFAFADSGRPPNKDKKGADFSREVKPAKPIADRWRTLWIGGYRADTGSAQEGEHWREEKRKAHRDAKTRRDKESQERLAREDARRSAEKDRQHRQKLDDQRRRDADKRVKADQEAAKRDRVAKRGERGR